MTTSFNGVFFSAGDLGAFTSGVIFIQATLLLQSTIIKDLSTKVKRWFAKSFNKPLDNCSE